MNLWAQLLLLATSICGLLSSRLVVALPALVPCETAARAGRWGLCAGADPDAGGSGGGGGAGAGAAAAPKPLPVILRGSNYIRLGGNLTSGCVGYHSTFDAGVYNRTRYVSAFRTMQSQGFNIMRVFIDARPGCGIGGDVSSTEPLDSHWLDRLAQFIADAESHGMYTLVTLNRPVNNAYFKKITSRVPLPPEWVEASGWNTPFLTERGHTAFATYGSALAQGLRARLAPAAQRAVLVSLENEFFLQGNLFPFSSHNATIQMADGLKYNMAEPAQRQEAADASTNLWARRTRKAIREYLPETLVTVGVFTFHAVHKKGPNGLILDGCNSDQPAPDPEQHVDCRFPARPLKLATGAGLDFLDVLTRCNKLSLYRRRVPKMRSHLTLILPTFLRAHTQLNIFT
eukprot:COSAG05_NODE_52_length_23775_cov_49.471110_9_plen_401_part_00